MSNRAIELHDSSVLRIEHEGADLVLHLEAYVHVSDGRPGIDAGSGGTQPATLRVEAAVIHERPPTNATLWVTEGHAEVDDQVFANLLPVPFDLTGNVQLKLQGAEGSMVATGTRIVVTLHGEFKFIEEFEGGK
jgi:hypothetical protein